MQIERFGDRDILLTIQEAAQLLRVSRATLYRLLGSGQLVGHKVGRGWRFYKTDIHSFVAAQGGGSAGQRVTDAVVAPLPSSEIVERAGG